MCIVAFSRHRNRGTAGALSSANTPAGSEVVLTVVACVSLPSHPCSYGSAMSTDMDLPNAETALKSVQTETSDKPG